MNKILGEETRRVIQDSVVEHLNRIDLMSKSTINSPRAVGDAVQEDLEHTFASFIPNGIVRDFNAAFARRAMADFAFTDIDDNYYVVDCKTHNRGTSFNMPNLTSVERLARFYEDHSNYFTVLLISYTVHGNALHFDECVFVPIEMLNWSCLTLGALGWGQIQIANSNNIVLNERASRKIWMLQLCDRLDIFYPNEISKITGRIDYFKKVREYWESQAE